MPAGWWQQLALVMAGGALGAGLRFWLGSGLLRRLGEGWPWGTLAANLLGAFAIGWLAEWLLPRSAAAQYWRAFLIVGVIGGLTTYSSLVLELLLLQRDDRWASALGYLATTLVAGLALVGAGARCGRWMATGWPG